MPDHIELSEARAKIAALDLRGVRNDLIEKDGFSEERAERAVSWYRMFLEFAVEHPGKYLAPPRAADMAWHNHILDTRRYMDDCLDIFGGYVHHDPEAFGTTIFDQGWDFTRELYADRYGVALPEIAQAAGDGDLLPQTCHLPIVEKIDRRADADADREPQTCHLPEVEAIERRADADADREPQTCHLPEVEKIERRP